LLDKELQTFKLASRLHLNHTLDISPAKWEGYSGFVSEAMIKDFFPEAASDVLVATCGPAPMNNLAINIFKSLGHKEHNIFKF
jgi:NAD(P)H-flavin reductase